MKINQTKKSVLKTKKKDESYNIFVSIYKSMNLKENSKDFLLLKKAYEISKTFHEGQLRKDKKTPYIIHSMTVGLLLAEVNSDIEIVIAGILHDTIEDTDYTIEKLQNDFGKTVTKLVSGVTFFKKSIKSKHSKIEQDEASVFQILSSIPNDYRIILIKIADVLHNLKSIQFLPPERQTQTIEKIKKYYLKLAEYLGVSRFWTEIIESIFAFEHPDEFKKISEYREQIFKKLKNFSIKKLKNELEKLINANIEILKSKREIRRIKPFDAVVCISIVFDDKINKAYKILNFLKNKFLERKLEKDIDYIKKPKENGWISYNTTLLIPKVGEVRFLIIPKSNYLINTFGINAISNPRKFHWKLETIRDFIKKGFGLKELTEEFLVNKIKVFETKTGKFYNLPKGSCILDLIALNFPEQFLFFESAFANREKINWKYKLQDDDLIDFISFSSTKTVIFFWNKTIKTNIARKILENHYGKKTFELMEKGYELLSKSLQTLNINLENISEYNLKRILHESGFTNFDDMIMSTAKKSKWIQKILKEKLKH